MTRSKVKVKVTSPSQLKILHLCVMCAVAAVFCYSLRRQQCHEILDVRRTRYEIDFNVVYLWFTNCLCDVYVMEEE